MTTICPVPYCKYPDRCNERKYCILSPAPLILRPLSDWRENPWPYPLRCDDKPRAVFPQGAQS